jgi:hypothetical protein
MAAQELLVDLVEVVHPIPEHLLVDREIHHQLRHHKEIPEEQVDQEQVDLVVVVVELGVQDLMVLPDQTQVLLREDLDCQMFMHMDHQLQ